MHLHSHVRCYEALRFVSKHFHFHFSIQKNIPKLPYIFFFFFNRVLIRKTPDAAVKLIRRGNEMFIAWTCILMLSLKAFQEDHFIMI